MSGLRYNSRVLRRGKYETHAGEVLANPALELRDGNGNLLQANDNWKSSQQSEITATGYATPNDLESAIVRTLSAGNYTASAPVGLTGILPVILGS